MKSLISFFVSLCIVLANSVVLAQQQSSYPYGSSDVSVINISPTIVPVDAEGGFYVWREYVDLTFAISNKNFNKQVGVRYTNDSWATYQEALASYAATDLNNGYERWSLHLELGYHNNQEPAFEVQIAAFVSYNNAPRSWDPNNNYFVNGKVDPANPLALITDGVKYDAASGNIIFSGLVRAYPYNRSSDFAAGLVQVHWTTDNWKTIQDSPATVTKASNYTWTFSVAIANKNKIPQNVTYVYKYNSSAGQKWLNNNGQNYYHVIAPQTSLNDNYGFLAPTQSSTPAKTFNGVDNVAVYAFSDVAYSQPTYTLDEIPVSGSSVYLNSTSLGNGQHTLTASIAFSNTNTVAQTLTYSFTVKNNVQFINEWIPAKPVATFRDTFDAWGAQAVNGKLYFAFNDLVGARYSSFGTPAAPEVLYTIPASPNSAEGYTQRIAVDDQTGSVFLLTSAGNIWKFLADGTLDTTFATSGRLPVNSNSVYGTSAICYAWDIKVVQSNLILADSCNNRLVRFNPATGAFLSEASIPSPGTFYTDSQFLYMSQEIYQQSSSILTLNATTLTQVAPPVVIPPVNPGSLGNTGISGFAVTSDKVFLALDYARLVRVSDAKSGTTLGEWLSGIPSSPPTSGAFDVMRSVVTLSDGSFAVLGVGWTGMERFSQTLL